jgi:hypothetical protein
MAGVNHWMHDLYPNMGFISTRGNSIPEAEDQNTLVDDQDLAESKQVHHDPVISKKMFITIGIIIAIVLLLSVKF